MKLFVWDFHGVLERGNELAVREFTNQVLLNNGFERRMTLEECYKLYGRKWYEYFKYLLPNENLEMCMKLQVESIKLSHKRKNILKKFVNINKYGHEVLSKISNKHDQVLISNSSQKSLNIFTKITGVDRYFNQDKILSANKHLNKDSLTKKMLLKNFLDGKKYDNLVVIGDSPDDMELAIFKNSVKYLYSHPELNHRNAVADYKIHDLREVLKEL